MASLLPALFFALAPCAQEAPENDGWVTDLANLLSASQEAELESLLESYSAGSGHEVALLTLPSLEGRPIEDVALRVFREWGVGDKDEDDGLLLVIAQKDRRMRFEVGYGLEGVLPDALCGRIIESVIAPEFRRERYYEGIRAGLLRAQEAIGGDYAELDRAAPDHGIGAAACQLALVGFFLFLVFASKRGRRAGGLGADGGLSPWLLATLLQSAGRSHGWHGGGGGGFSGGGRGGGFGGFGGGRSGGGGASGGW